MMENVSRKQTKRLDWSLHLAGLAVTTAIIGGGWISLYQPLDREGRQLERRTTETAEFLEEAGQIKTQNAQLRVQLAGLEGQLDNLMARLPETADESGFLAQLRRLADETQLEIRDFRPEAAFDKENHREMEVRLSADGNHESICRFLDGLKTLRRLCRVKRLSVIVPDAKRNQVGTTYVVEMTLRIFFAPLESTDT